MAFEDAIISRPVSVVIPVISSLAGTLRAYVSSVLPQSYVKDYFIDTEVLITRIWGRRKFRPLTTSQLALRQLPLMTIKVEPTADQSEFASGTTFWRSTRFLQDPTLLTRLIVDDNGLRYAGYETERMVLRFTVSFTVETDLRASELMMYLRRSLPVGNKVYLNDIDVTTEIPREILRSIWNDLQLGDGSNPDDVTAFREYLQRVTGGNVEQQVNSASGRLTYSYSYRTNPLMTVGGPPSMNVNREGNVVRNATVELPFEFDVEVPVAYAYRCEETLAGDPFIPQNLVLEDMDGSAHFSASIRTRPPENINGELQLVFFTSVVTDRLSERTSIGSDTTDLSSSISPRINTLVHRLLEDTTTLQVEARLWLDGVDIPDTQWTMDMDTMQLTISSPAYQPQQRYHFAIYANVADIETLAPVARRPQVKSPMIKPKAT